MSKILPIALIALLTASAPPPPAAFTLEGVVLDRLLGTPLADATVSLSAARLTVTTQSDGTFAFSEVAISGPDEIVVTHPAYQTARIRLGTLGDGAWHFEVTIVRTLEVVGGPPLEDLAR